MGTVRRHSSRLLVVAVLTGCGGAASDGETARYLDPRSDAVVAVDLDYEGGNWEQIKRLYGRGVEAADRDAPPTLDALLDEWASEVGLSFADDVRPLLGGTLHVGVSADPAAPEAREDPPTVFTATYRVEEPEALARLLEKLRGRGLEARPIDGVDGARRLAEGVATVGDDTIVAVVSDDDGAADRLLRERLSGSGDGPEVPELGDDFVAVRAAPTLLGAWFDRDELDRALATAAGRALRAAEASVRLDEDAARADARVDFEGLDDDELPLPEAGPLELPAGESVVSGSGDQSRTTVFLARLVRKLYPYSGFVRRVEALEQSLGLRFEDEVLRQFAGPSFSVLRPAGPNGTEFGARSTLRDPAAMRELLPRLAPALPGILESLKGLGSTGLTSLLLVAPDAPLTPGSFGMLAAVRVSRLAGAASEQLYEVRGIDTHGVPEHVVYGIVGDAFVVGSTPELAREVAAMSTEQAPEAATRLRDVVAEAELRWTR